MRKDISRKGHNDHEATSSQPSFVRCMCVLCVLMVLGLLVGCTPTPSGVNPTIPIPTPTPVPLPTEDIYYAPDFALTALDGARYQLSDLRGQWVIINFWATWCVPCVTEMPALQALADTYQDQLIVLAINQREPRESVSAFVAEHQLRFPILLDPTDDVLLDYQVINLPQTLIVDPIGALVFRSFGEIELSSFTAQLTELGLGL